MKLRKIALVAAGLLLPTLAFAATAAADCGCSCGWCPF